MTLEYKRGSEIARGKTKIIYEVQEHSKLVWIEGVDNITANNDPSMTKEFEGKADMATQTTSRNFELLRRHGIPVGYVRQEKSNVFIAPRLTMILLEVVVRNSATGSFLKRHPEYKREGDEMHSFGESPLFELFLKTTNGELVIDGEKVVEGLTPETDDPLINLTKDPAIWELFHPKREDESLGLKVHSQLILNPGGIRLKIDVLERIRSLAINTTKILTWGWGELGCTLVDIKYEFGITPDGVIVLGDVVDNDSWRMRDAGGIERSKQTFRDGDDLHEVAKNYKAIADLAEELENL